MPLGTAATAGAMAAAVADVARPLARAAVRAGAAGLATAASEAGGGAELAEEGTDSVAPVASPGVVAVLEAALMVTRAA